MTTQADKKPGFWDNFGQFLITILAILTFRWALFEPFVIPSGSMIPTILIHDHIVASKYVYGLRWPFTQKWMVRWSQPQRGEIVIFKSIEEGDYFMIKRVVGVEGDQLAIDHTGQLVVNSQPVTRVEPKLTQMSDIWSFGDLMFSDEDIQAQFSDVKWHLETLPNTDRTHLMQQYADRSRWAEDLGTVPMGHVYVMGDNRDNSRDSRFWGYLPINQIIGRGEAIWLSCEKTLTFASSICDPTTLRWNRMFTRLH